MNQLENTLTSLEVAEMVERRHDQVIRDIRKIIEQLADHKSVDSSDLGEAKNGLSSESIDINTFFIESTYTSAQNKELPCYLVTKQGCEVFGNRMTGAKGTQFTVGYVSRFNQMEQHIKQQPDISNLSPELQMFNQMFQAVASQEQKLVEVNDKVDNISNIFALNTANWRSETGNWVRQMAIKQGGGIAFKEINQEIYAEVERRGGFKFNVRLRNMQTRQIEKGYSKSAVKKLNKLDVIEADKKATQIYIQVVKEFAIKYQVDVA
ncbi:Rha family transcriptional regulator [Lactococcus lactis]|uniref:Rha family transcriptional regulator n=1 Tax=Lactococcus lactis TaxID=1358 RepID=A0AAE4NQ64_9LACT|nr:Rha family transcriptional regulator [Lactococcus lactis]MDV2632743.1 Rha family transcriptional regulator [Lactococcus lactis]